MQSLANRLFRDRPASVDESYLQHMGVASSFGWAMLQASGASGEELPEGLLDAILA